MSQIEIERVVAQIRELRQKSVGATSSRAESLTSAGSDHVVSFEKVLRNGLDAVDRADARARSSAAAFERGAPGVDLASVMIDMQKASIGFRATVEVRNRVVAAYQDIMNMPI